MSFDKHAFISYAHIDNQPVSEDDKGWISDFHDSLKALLETKLGEEADIWRDKKLDGSDIFDDEIVENLRKAALLISILTPRYVKSDWCTKELKEFCNSARENLGIRIGNKSRILKVIKTPIDDENIPDEVKGTLGYEFFKIDKNHRAKEFNKIFGEDAEHAYLQKVDDMACDIRDILKLLNENTPIDRRITIYVAETSYDLREERNQIVRELKDHGCEVFPDEELPNVEEELKNKVSHYMGQCQMAIHLVGKSYGFIPDGPSNRSVIELQNELAANRSKETGMPRYIWMPKDLKYNNEKQSQFITYLNEDRQAHCEADIIEGSIEDLKYAMHEKIKQIKNPVKQEESTGLDNQKKVYLICDARDLEETRQLRKYLIKQDIEVTIPIFEGKPADIRKFHVKNLKVCDAVIIFHGKGDDSWLQTKRDDLKKNRTTPLLATSIYLGPPSSFIKEDNIEMELPDYINGLKGFSPDLLSEFMKKVTKP